MADLEEGNFDGPNDSGSKTYPMQCSALRKNGHVLMKGKPCKIVEMSTSKTGKHGHAKVNLTGIDIFDGKKYEDMSPSTHNMIVPVVSRQEYTVVNIEDDGYLTLMDENGETREDLNCEHNLTLFAEIEKKFNDGDDFMVSVTKAMDREQIMAIKNLAQSG